MVRSVAVAGSKNWAVSTCWATISASVSAPVRAVSQLVKARTDEAEEDGESRRQDTEDP
jgi:hypothetical protein